MTPTRILFASALAISVLASAPIASAQESTTSPAENAFSRGELQIDPGAVHIALEARGDIDEPRVRTESGFIRLWFPHMVGWTNLDLEGDGSAIRFVRVRPGADDTGVVVIRVGDARRVAVGSVGVTRAANHVVITLSRNALPPVLENLPPPAPAVATPAEAPTPPPTEAPAAAIAPSTGAAAIPTDGERSAAEALLAPATAEAPATVPTLGIPTAQSPSTLATLLGITVLLALALGAVQWIRSRNGAAPNAPSIRIVASARLSPKQQLVVVRALGQDHLIALEPGHTERLLSIPAAEPTRGEEELVPELRLSRPVAPIAAANGAPPANFAAELMRLVDPKGARGHAPTQMAPAPTPPANANSEAVAGLVRLRAAASR